MAKNTRKTETKDEMKKKDAGKSMKKPMPFGKKMKGKK